MCICVEVTKVQTFLQMFGHVAEVRRDLRVLHTNDSITLRVGGKIGGILLWDILELDLVDSRDNRVDILGRDENDDTKRRFLRRLFLIGTP